MQKALYTDSEFWDKKVTLSYILAIFVFFIHNSSFAQYSYDGEKCSKLCEFLSELFPVIGRVAVPLFMIIAGALFFRNYSHQSFASKLKKRVNTLLLPYLAWNTIAMIFSIFVTIFLSKYFIGRQPFEFSVTSVLKSIFFKQENGQMWFVFDLILYIIISPLLYCMLRNKFLCGAYFLCITTAHIFGYLPESILFDSSSLIFYSIGAYIGVHRFEWMKVKSIIPHYLSLPLILLSITCLLMIKGGGQRRPIPSFFI